jgi:hypothetical protein
MTSDLINTARSILLNEAAPAINKTVVEFAAACKCSIRGNGDDAQFELVPKDSKVARALQNDGAAIFLFAPDKPNGKWDLEFFDEMAAKQVTLNSPSDIRSAKDKLKAAVNQYLDEHGNKGPWNI